MKKTLTALLALVSISSNAGNVLSSGNVVSQITAYSVEESIYTNWRGYIQVTPSQSIQWSGSGCSTHSVGVRNQDQHLIDLIKLAYINSKQMTFAADSSVPKIDGQTCVLRAVMIE